MTKTEREAEIALLALMGNPPFNDQDIIVHRNRAGVVYRTNLVTLWVRFKKDLEIVLRSECQVIQQATGPF